MKTCVSMNCPFIDVCKDYNFLVDRTGGCETQKRIVKAAERRQTFCSDTTTLSAIKKIKTIKDILSRKTGVSDAQEFGLSYGQAINYLEEIEEAIFNESQT